MCHKSVGAPGKRLSPRPGSPSLRWRFMPFARTEQSLIPQTQDKNTKHNIDPDGLEWKAPKGLVTDGASIPQIAWTPVGGPFEGLYRLAAVVHDAARSEEHTSELQ